MKKVKVSPKERRKIPAIWKWLGGIILVILTGVLCFAFYLSQHWKPILKERIQNAVLNATDNLYTINFDDISMNLVTGNVGFKNIVFKPDSAVYQRMKLEGIAPRHVFQVEIAGLILQRVHPGKVYFRKKLEMNSIIIDSPAIKVAYDQVATRSAAPTDKRTAYERLSKFLESVKIQNIILKNVAFNYTDHSLRPQQTTVIKNLQVRVTDLLIDSASQFDKKRFYYTKDIFVQVRGYNFITKNRMYTVRLGELSSSTSGGYVRFSKLRIKPNYPDLQFSRKYKFKQDRYDLRFNEILLNNINFEQLNTQRRLIASSLVINKAYLNIFENRELPQPPGNKAGSFPQLVLKRLQINTRIDTLKFKDADIDYTEYNPKDARRGTLFFKNVEGEFHNITNDSLILSGNNWCRGNTKGLLMGEGLLNLNLNLNLTDPGAAFNYSGSIGAMDLRILNPLVKSLAMIEITSGRVDQATFSAHANVHSSSGKLKFTYTDLKIGILKKDETSDQLKKRGLLSLLANVILIKNNNPVPGEPLRVGHMSFVRPPSGSFFNLLWNGLFSGLKESIGISKEVEQKLKEKAAGGGAKKEQRKKRRAERKQKREIRREKRKEMNERQKTGDTRS